MDSTRACRGTARLFERRLNQRTSEPILGVLNRVQCELDWHYNSAWPTAAPSTLAGLSGSTMSTNERETSYQKPCLSEADLLAITDAIPISISVLAPDGTILYVNRLGLDRIGVSLDELKVKGYLERTCHPDDLDRALSERRMGLSKTAPFQLEMRLRPKNGDYRWHISQYNPLIDEHGHVIRWYLTTTDIDDRKRAEERMRQSESDLRTITDAIPQSIVVLAPDSYTGSCHRAPKRRWIEE